MVDERHPGTTRSRLNGRTGLIIDPRPQVRFQIGAALQRAGATAGFACDALEAMDFLQDGLAHNRPHDFVLVRVAPDDPNAFDGLSVTRALRDGGHLGALVAMIENCTEPMLLQACLEAGCDAAIGVPFEETECLATLSDHLPSMPVGETLLNDLQGVSPNGMLMQRFMEHVPHRVEALQEAIRDCDARRLELTLKQFKEAANAHQLPEIAQEIHRLEHQAAAHEAELSQLIDAVDHLRSACHKAAFHPDHAPQDPPPRPVA